MATTTFWEKARISLVAFVSAAAAAPVNAEATLYQRGVWEVQLVHATAELMAYCDATGQASNGRQSVSIIAYDSGLVSLMFFDAAWHLAPEQFIEAIANIDYDEWPVTAADEVLVD